MSTRRLFLQTLGFGTLGLATKAYSFMIPDPLREVTPLTLCGLGGLVDDGTFTVHVHGVSWQKITKIDVEARRVDFEPVQPRLGEQVGSMYEAETDLIRTVQSPLRNRPQYKAGS